MPQPPDRRRDLARTRSRKSVFEPAGRVSRGFVLIPVAALLISAVAAFVCGTAMFVWSLLNVIRHPLEVSRNVGHFLLMTDVFLVGMMMLVAAMGLYELFIRPVSANRPGAHLPRRRITTGPKDVAVRLVPMLVLIAVVSFAAVAAGVRDGRDVLLLGGGLTIVIAALMAFWGFGADHPPNS
jgi:uncharacterized membrane protein YqhA